MYVSENEIRIENQFANPVLSIPWIKEHLESLDLSYNKEFTILRFASSALARSAAVYIRRSHLMTGA